MISGLSSISTIKTQLLMRFGANRYLSALPAILLPGLLLVASCTNDIKKIREVTAARINNAVDTTKGVDAIYSDSAKVKIRLQTPLMLEYEVSKTVPKRYVLMPKGVNIIFFNDSTKKSGNITADTAYWYMDQNLYMLRKNVVVKNVKGDTFKSEELNWDAAGHKIYSTKPIDVYMTNGSTGHGTSMQTNEKFDPFTVQNQTGIIYLDHSITQ